MDEKFYRAIEKRDRLRLLQIITAYKILLEGEAKREEVFLSSPDLNEILGVSVSMRDVLCHRIANLDLIFDNIIVTEEGQHFVIDHEWVFNFEIPVPSCYTVGSRCYIPNMESISKHSFLSGKP